MNINKELKLDATERFELEYEGHRVIFDAKTVTLTPQFLKDVGDIVSYPKAVADVLSSWDVTADDDGTPYPINESELARLPVTFLTAIINRIGESWGGDSAKKKSGSNGSAQTASSGG